MVVASESGGLGAGRLVDNRRRDLESLQTSLASMNWHVCELWHCSASGSGGHRRRQVKASESEWPGPATRGTLLHGRHAGERAIMMRQ
jgi:hypothetical protein